MSATLENEGQGEKEWQVFICMVVYKIIAEGPNEINRICLCLFYNKQAT